LIDYREFINDYSVSSKGLQIMCGYVINDIHIISTAFAIALLVFAVTSN